jgi:hypothetical protein
MVVDKDNFFFFLCLGDRYLLSNSIMKSW